MKRLFIIAFAMLFIGADWSALMFRRNAKLSITQNPGTVALVDTQPTIWSGIDLVKTDNNTSAVVLLGPSPNDTSDQLLVTNFGFAVPIGSTITGIKVGVKAMVPNVVDSLLYDFNIDKLQLYRDGAVIGSDLSNDTKIVRGESYNYYNVGGKTNLWGTTWTAGQVNNAGTGILFGAYYTSVDAIANEMYVDHIRMTVYYTKPTSQSSLLEGLVSYWKLNEQSGTRVDIIGGNNLTDNNTVLYGSGKVGNAADLESSNNEFLSITDNASLSFADTDDFTVSAWIKLETDGIFIPVIMKCSELADDAMEYGIYLYPVDGGTANQARMAIANGTNVSFATSTVTIGTGSWAFLCGWYNAATDSVYIVTNTETTPARAKALYGPYDSDKAFMIGSFEGETYPEFDGLIDIAGVWGRCPTKSDGFGMVDSLYNAGAGWSP